MLFFRHADMVPDIGNRGEPLLPRFLSESRVKIVPFVVFAVRRLGKIFLGRADHAGGKRRRDLQLAALKKLEETFRMLLLLIRGLLENVGDLDKTVLARPARKISIAVARLRLSGKRFEKIFFGFCSLDRLHDFPLCCWLDYVVRTTEKRRKFPET